MHKLNYIYLVKIILVEDLYKKYTITSRIHSYSERCAAVVRARARLSKPLPRQRRQLRRPRLKEFLGQHQRWRRKPAAGTRNRWHVLAAGHHRIQWSQRPGPWWKRKNTAIPRRRQRSLGKQREQRRKANRCASWTGRCRKDQTRETRGTWDGPNGHPECGMVV